MSDGRSVLERVARAAQACFQLHPVVVLGSGASISHQIRGMPDLASYLTEHVVASEGEETDAWTLIKAALANNDGLEKALQDQTAPATLVKKIVRLYIPERAGRDGVDDISVGIFERIAKEGRKYGLGLVVISQRPSEVNRTVLSQCNNVIAKPNSATIEFWDRWAGEEPQSDIAKSVLSWRRQSAR